MSDSNIHWICWRTHENQENFGTMFLVWAPRGEQCFPHFFNIPLITGDPGCGVGVGWGGVGVITSCMLVYYVTCYAVLRSCTLAAHMYCHAGYVANTSASGVGVITSCTLAQHITCYPKGKSKKSHCGNTYGVDSGVASMRATFSRAWVSSAKTNGMDSRKKVLKFKRFPTWSANTWENNEFWWKHSFLSARFHVFAHVHVNIFWW